MRFFSPLVFATVLNIISLGLLIPALPFQVIEMSNSAFLAGVIFSFYSALSFIFSPYWGGVSDRIGRKPVLLISIGMTALSYLWLAYADALWEIYLSRGIAGIFAGWMVASQAYAADLSSAENRVKSMGFLGAAFGIGFTIGPGLQGVIASFGGFREIALCSFFIALITLVYTFFFIKEPEGKREEEREYFVLKSLPNLIKDTPDLLRLFFLFFTVFFVFTASEGTLGVWTKEIASMDQAQFGYLLATAGIIASIIQGGMIGRLNAKFGERNLVIFSYLFLAVGLLSVLIGTSFALMFIPLGFIAIGMSLHSPPMQAYISATASKHEQGRILGIGISMQSLARVLGPAIGGALYQYFDATAPFIIGACLIVPLLFVILKLPKRIKS